MTVQAFQPRAQPCFQCPFDWIRYRGKCYYFSVAEGNWTSSQDNCSALGASLAMLDSMEDLVRKHDDLLSMGGKTQKQCIWNLLVSLIALTGSFLNIWGEKLGKRPWGYVNMGVFKLLTKGNCCKKCRNKPLFLGDTFWKEIEMVKPQRSPEQHEKLVNLWFFFCLEEGKNHSFSSLSELCDEIQRCLRALDWPFAGEWGAAMAMGEPLASVSPVSPCFSLLCCWLVFPQPQNVHFF